MGGWLAWLLDVVVPSRCAACGVFGSALCRRCSRRIAQCPLIVREAAAHMPRAYAAGAYAAELRRAIHTFKFRNCRAVGISLAKILAYKLAAATDVVVPVPLHADRLRARGYNQAEVIAQVIGRVHAIPVAVRALRRIWATAPQSELDLRAREMNVAGAFDAGSDFQAALGARVLLVDDVITTGATIGACAEVLRKCGAATISAAALALRL